MARYINANMLVQDIERNRANNDLTNAIASQAHNAGHRHFIKMVLDQPTADVVPREEVMKIFAEVENIIIANTYPDFNSKGKPCNVWKPKSGYDALEELKKKYTKGDEGK